VDELPFAADRCPCVEKLRTCYQLLLASETVRCSSGVMAHHGARVADVSHSEALRPQDGHTRGAARGGGVQLLERLLVRLAHRRRDHRAPPSQVAREERFVRRQVRRKLRCIWVGQ
jgi:hypothetical protein